VARHETNQPVSPLQSWRLRPGAVTNSANVKCANDPLENLFENKIRENDLLMKSPGDRARLSFKSALLIMGLLAALVASGCARTAPARGWSGPTVSGDNLYYGSMDGRLIAVNINNSSEEWAVPLETGRVSTGLGCTSAPIVVSMYGPPAVSDNLVYVGGYNGKVYAFSGKTEPRWV